MLRLLKLQGFRRGVIGANRTWFAVWAVISAGGLLRRFLGRKEETVFHADLEPGEVLVIAHQRDVVEVEQRPARRPGRVQPAP